MEKKKSIKDWVFSNSNQKINEKLTYGDSVSQELYDSLLLDFHNEFVLNHPDALGKDVLWGYYNFLLVELVSLEKNLAKLNSKLSTVYGEMYLFRYKYDKVYDARLSQLNLDYQLKSIDYSDNGFLMKVVIIPNKNCCEYCDLVSKMEFTYEESQQGGVVDVSKCTNMNHKPMWTCAIVPKRDSEGNLIRLKNDSEKVMKDKVSRKSKGCLLVIVVFLLLVFLEFILKK